MIQRWAHKLEKLRGRSFDEALVRGRQYFTRTAERMNFAVRGAPSVTARNLSGRLGLTRGMSGEDPRNIAVELGKLDKILLSNFREAAQSLFDGNATLLGCGPLPVGNPPKWHRDAMSGISAPIAHWSKIRFLDPRVVGDHKVVWEINRHQYLFPAAFVWLHDGEPEIFHLIQAHLRSWLDENPTRIGVNWASSLEVAYRAITWCWLLWMLRDAPWDRTLEARLLTSLESHALHVERYLSTYFSPNTHLTGEALGLFYVGSLLPQSKHSSRLRARGGAILEQAIDQQVLPDGVYFEQASLYQRYTIEIYMHYLRLARATDWQADPKILAHLGRMLDVFLTLSDGSARVPLLGDDDGGQLLPLDYRPPDVAADVLLAGAVLLDRPDLVPSSVIQPALACWMMGVEPTVAMIEATKTGPQWSNAHFASGGVAVLRDGWDVDTSVATVDAGPHGAMNCGHAHADALSCTLSVRGQPVFIDRGTLTYVGPERNEYRSTAAHNTLEFDGESSIEPLGPFQWGAIPPKPSAEVLEYGEVSVFTGIAVGHAGTSALSTHRRLICHPKGGAWLFIDHGVRLPSSSAVVRWQLHPDLTAAEMDDYRLELRRGKSVLVGHVVTPLTRQRSLRSREVSLRYGGTERATAIALEDNCENLCVTLLIPASSKAADYASPTVDHSAIDRVEINWEDDEGAHRILVSKSLPIRHVDPGLTLKADLIWSTGDTRELEPGRFGPTRIFCVADIGQADDAPSRDELIVVDNPIRGTVLGRRDTEWSTVLPTERRKDVGVI